MIEPAELHDGTVTGLHIENDVLTVDCVLEDGRSCTIILKDVVTFQANNFRVGNIILCLEISRDTSGGRMRNLATRLGILPESIPGMTCVELVPSYGVEIVAFCRTSESLQIVENGRPVAPTHNQPVS